MQAAHVNENTTGKEDAANWKFVPAKDKVPAYHVYTVPVQKSPADDREYRVIRLENGLEAALVHDKKTDKAAASMNVAVGYSEDPGDLPLAHFCEHLLFMGSKAFPKENEFSEYISKNTGFENARTSRSDTVFYFSVASHALEGALQRFAPFFHSPLFDEKSTMREINAVDSEHSKHLQSDVRRIRSVQNHLACPGHPLRKFGCGNKKVLMEAVKAAKALPSKEALTDSNPAKSTRSSRDTPTVKQYMKDRHSRGISASNGASIGMSSGKSKKKQEANAGGMEARRRLLEWWKKEYCAGRMSLAIVGKESLDDLTRFAVKLFSPIKNRGQDPAPLLTEPYGQKELGKIVYVKTIMDSYNVTIAIPISWQAPLWHVKPAGFLGHLIGHEGPGSLHAYLKNTKGWVSKLYAGAPDIGRGASLFKIYMELTEDGFKNYREVIKTCFKFFNLLRNSKLPEWAQKELKIIRKASFRFDEKGDEVDYARCISGNLKLPIPRALLLNGPRLIWGCDEGLVRDTLDRLIIEKSFIIVAAKDHSKIGRTGPWLTEPWHKAEYMEQRHKDGFVSATHKTNDICELALPKRNEFIPEISDVDIVYASKPRKRPALIKRTPLMELWHKKDDQFGVPKAHVVISAEMPFAGMTAHAVVMTRLFGDLVEDALSEYSYNASVADLKYSISGDMYGISLVINGYNDKLYTLGQRVIEKVKHVEVKIERLAVMIEKEKQRQENTLLGEPLSLSKHYFHYLLADRSFSIEENLKALKEITVEGLSEHVKTLLSQLKYTVLVTGNYRKEEALHIASTIEHTLGASQVPANQLPVYRSRLLPKGCNYIWERTVPNPNETDSGISYYCHIGNVSDARTRVTCRLLSNILDDPAFDILRTKEQLGYTVRSSFVSDTESIGWYLGIQSNKDPKYLESRIEAFLVHMREEIKKMEENKGFKSHKESLVNGWEKKLKNIPEETDRFWTAIRSDYYDFRRAEKDAELVQSVSKDEMLNMFKECLDPTSKTRSKLSVHMRSQNPPATKLSKNAAKTFLSALKKARIPVKEEFKLECENEPPAAHVRAYFEEGLRGILKNREKVERLLSEYDKLVETYPVRGQEAVKLSSKVEFIKDGAKFRESLELSGPAKPVEKYEVE